MKTNRYFNFMSASLICVAIPCVGQNDLKVKPESPIVNESTPSKAFLMYLAELERVNEEWVGPLDMDALLEQENKRRDEVDVKCDRSKNECKK
ncbi:hypothetical protein NI389_09920 [Pseudoalteromonas xiamenensis]|uniref:hypothetical protein n=1 Tax=Pseudoalteromonas xiamenensis TaxID=882626 RepID=UPI0027E4F2A7|nr:hypothetical protein [Pseudoalteromonas xiamenensis]WMN58575.1 hypothetical protein NI389_09920 [Pseudoalteromonas xiamenensis]